MTPGPGHLLALGGGGFTDLEAGPLDELALSLTGVARPRACLIPTASGDASPYIAAFYRTFGRRARCTHIPLFQREAEDLRALVLAQDVLYIGGGNTANLLALWRLHGLDTAVREAWEAGAVLVGVSAGACALFEGGISASFGALAPLTGGLGLVAGAFAPHWPERGRLLVSMLDGGGSGAAAGAGAGAGADRGWGASDTAALHFIGEELHEAVGLGQDAEAFRVYPGPAVEALPVRALS